MLVQHPHPSCFAVSGDYCPSSSTRSTQTQPLAHFLGLPIPIRIVLNSDPTLQASPFPVIPTGRNIDIQNYQQIKYSGDCGTNIFTPLAINMPRHSRSNENQDNDPPVFTEPLGPIAAGCKRDASALSTNCAVVPASATTAISLDSNDQCNIYLPPKSKESERMMHIQRWVNHLPWNTNNPCDASGRPHLTYPIPTRSYIDEDRELTPPPGRTYLTRLPFTHEEQQAMLRLFPSHHNQYRHQHQTGAIVPDPQPRFHPFPNQCSNQQPSNNNNNHFSTSQRPSQDAGNGFQPARHLQDYLHETDVEHTHDDSGSRWFADWETRLISHLFKEFFHDSLKTSGVSGTLPSLNEVRSRIAATRLKDKRTATAIRSKIRRMQSSGVWLKYQ